MIHELDINDKYYATIIFKFYSRLGIRLPHLRHFISSSSHIYWLPRIYTQKGRILLSDTQIIMVQSVSLIRHFKFALLSLYYIGHLVSEYKSTISYDDVCGRVTKMDKRVICLVTKPKFVEQDSLQTQVKLIVHVEIFFGDIH